MYLPSHMAFGYLVVRGVEWWRGGKRLSSLEQGAIVIASVVPDVDGLLSDSVAGHHMATHTPLFWLVGCGLVYLGGRAWRREWLGRLAACVLIGALGHLATDWGTARTVGIQWLWPLFNTDYYLYPIDPSQGQIGISGMLGAEYLRFYASNRLLLVLELMMSLAALALLVARSFRRSPRG